LGGVWVEKKKCKEGGTGRVEPKKKTIGNGKSRACMAEGANDQFSIKVTKRQEKTRAKKGTNRRESQGVSGEGGVTWGCVGREKKIPPQGRVTQLKFVRGGVGDAFPWSKTGTPAQ